MKSNYKFAVIFSLIANFAFALINITINKMQYDINAIRLFFFQMLFSCIFLAPWMFRNGISVLKTSQIKLHAMRGIIAIFSVFFFYSSLRILTPVDAVLIKSTSPFFVPALAMLWLGEKIPKITWLLILFGFVGVYFVIGPFDSRFSFAHLFPLLSAVGYAYMIVSVNKLREKDSPQQVLYYYNLTGLVFLSPIIALTWNPMPLEVWMILGVLALLFAIGQVAIVMAYSYSMPGRLAPFIFSEVFFTYLLLQIFFEVTVSKREFLGGGIIVFSALMMFWVMAQRREPSVD